MRLLVHTNFKQVMQGTAGGEGSKKRFREKPNRNGGKKQDLVENGIWSIQSVFASLPMAASHVYLLLGFSWDLKLGIGFDKQEH